MAKEKPAADRIFTWLRANLGGPGALAALTGTDACALKAAVSIAELHQCYDRRVSLALAFAEIVRSMQPQCFYFAYHAIGMVSEWTERLPFWRRAGLPDLAHVPLCDYEPGGQECRHQPIGNTFPQ